MMDSNREMGPQEPHGPRGFLSGKGRFVLIGVVLVLALAYLVYAAFPGNKLYYYTVEESLADSSNLDGKSIRVVGTLVPESYQRVEGSSELLANFTITDEVRDLDATYNGVLPDLFFNPHSEIVLEGSFTGEGQFHTDNIIVKCPTKYQAQTETEAEA